MSAPMSRREFAKRAIDRAIRLALDSCDLKPRRRLAEVLWKVRSRSDLLKPGRHAGDVDREGITRIVGGLRAMVFYRHDWLRPVETWEPSGSTPVQLFSSLAHHLLANYPVPPVLLSSWLEGTDWRSTRYQRCFLSAGLGKSLREINLPIPLTKRMAHEFAGAPDHFPIDYALRWAQVRGLGGGDPLAHVVAATRWDSDYMNNEFWVSAFRLFINTPRLDLACIGPILEYLQDRKFECQQVLIGEGTAVYLSAVEPELSIKGRTVASLMKRVEEWRAEKKRATLQHRFIQWQPSPFHEFQREADRDRLWTIRELLDSDSLAAEGKAMKHCVAEYTDPCSRRESTIWSLGRESPEGRERFVTIEVNPETKSIVQATMKLNAQPDQFSMTLVKEWAEREGLLVEV